MKKEKITRNKRIFIIGGILIAVMLVLTGCGNKEDNSKALKNESKNQVQNIEKENENTVPKQDENTALKQDANTVTKQEKNQASSNNNTTNNSNTTKSTSTNNKSTTSNALVVNREGVSEEIPSKEYSSSLGYTMRYASEFFSVSYHDDGDWYDCNPDYNCVVVEKENVSYSKKVASISNYNKTEVNGYEAVYTTRHVEGQFETIYYVNSGKDSTYKITTSCQGDTEHLEGIGKIMDAMVQTFSIK